MPQSHNSFLPTNQLLSGSLQMKDCIWFLVQALVLEISLIFIRTCWILKNFGQRKDIKMSPRKCLSCLPHERINTHNFSRVWQLYSLEHIDSNASITWIHAFCFQDATISYATCTGLHKDLHSQARQGIFFPFEISLRWMLPVFLTPVLLVVLYLWGHECQNQFPVQLYPAAAVSRQNQK